MQVEANPGPGGLYSVLYSGKGEVLAWKVVALPSSSNDYQLSCAAVSSAYSAPDSDMRLARNSAQAPLKFGCLMAPQSYNIRVVDPVVCCPGPFRTGAFTARSTGARQLSAESLSRNYTQREPALWREFIYCSLGSPHPMTG